MKKIFELIDRVNELEKVAEKSRKETDKYKQLNREFQEKWIKDYINYREVYILLNRLDELLDEKIIQMYLFENRLKESDAIITDKLITELYDTYLNPIVFDKNSNWTFRE